MSTPLVYSCSGCSNIAQMANQLALDLTRDGHAEMSCIAGVGGGVKKLVKVARSGREIIALDGCALHCVKNCLAQNEVEATHHFTLTDYGTKKRHHKSFESHEYENLKRIVYEELTLE